MGLFSFRFVLQPLTASDLRHSRWSGRMRAQAGPPVLLGPCSRGRMSGDGCSAKVWKAVARVIGLGANHRCDLFRRSSSTGSIHFSSSSRVLGLAFLPYVVIRGPIRRIATWWRVTRQFTRSHVHLKARPDHAHRRTDRARPSPSRLTTSTAPESDMYFAAAVRRGGFARFAHHREADADR